MKCFFFKWVGLSECKGIVIEFNKLIKIKIINIKLIILNINKNTLNKHRLDQYKLNKYILHKGLIKIKPMLYHVS